MWPMSEYQGHRYTFTLTDWANASQEQTASKQRVSTIAPSPAAAERRVRANFPAARSIVLTGVAMGDTPCGDDRCAVCNPSSRNRAA